MVGLSKTILERGANSDYEMIRENLPLERIVLSFQVDNIAFDLVKTALRQPK